MSLALSSNMASAILGGLVDALVGSILGFGIAYFAFVLGRKTKIIECRVFSMSLLGFTPTINHALNVSVDRSLLTGEIADKGSSVQIESAYGFEIVFLNVGNETIEEPTFEISLNESAKIIQYETRPIGPRYKIATEQDAEHPHVLHVVAPYINSGERIFVRLLSTNNLNRECRTKAYGCGVKIRRQRQISNVFLNTFISLILGGLITISIELVLLFMKPNLHVAIFLYIINVLSFIIYLSIITYNRIIRSIRNQWFYRNWDWKRRSEVGVQITFFDVLKYLWDALRSHS